MTVKEAMERFGFEALALPAPDREIAGGYCGDLLSWVMTRLQADEAWVTIMSNINVVAVASLADAACVILSENAEADEAFIAKANEQAVNILRSAHASFAVCAMLGNCGNA